MKKALWLLIGISTAVNVWLFTRPIPASPAASAGTAPSASTTGAKMAASGAAKSSAANPAVPSPEKAAKIKTLIDTLVSVDSKDPAGARDKLRAAGADEETVFAVVDGMLRLQFYRQKRIAETENIHDHWWRGGTTSGPNYPLWGSSVVIPGLDLVGPDPHDLIDFKSRFDFLPDDKATMLAKMSVDYFALYMQFTDDSRKDSVAGNDRMLAERQKDLIKLLTPEERAEYDLRFNEAAEQNTRRYSKMDATEKEYRAIAPIVDRAQKENANLSGSLQALVNQAGGAGGTAAQAATTQALLERANTQRANDQRTLDDMVAAVGYDRALDYLWSGAQIAVRDSSNPSSTGVSLITNAPPQMLQLAAETGQAAAAIHYDTSLSPDAKRAALLALQQSTQPKLDQILPPDSRADLDPQALTWFNVLAKGEYVTLPTPRVTGTFTTVITPTSVTTPVRGTYTPPVLVRAKK